MKPLDVSSPVTTEYFVARLRQRRLLEGQAFENFIVGDTNKAAHAAAVQVTRHPGSACNPLLIYGANGYGSTHLMCAIGHRLISKVPDLVVQYVHAEDFHADVVHAYQSHSFEHFQDAYRSCDVLLLDDICFFSRNRLSLAAPGVTREALSWLLDALPPLGKQIVMTYGDLPGILADFEPYLARRILKVAAVEIAPPDFDLHLAILKNRAKQLGSTLPDDVSNFIAESMRGPQRARATRGAVQGACICAFSQTHARPRTGQRGVGATDRSHRKKCLA